MEEFAIICIDDERDVLDALTNDLEKFSRHFRIEPAESAKDAMSVLDELEDDEVEVALVLADHIMPGMSGVDFLIGLRTDKRTSKAKKVLITAQAGLDATIDAVNRANLDHMISESHGLVRNCMKP
ncbi:MAG: response regulator [Planctomycetota bacterium]|nr:response regulator [Planctomycetota bacterium]